MEKKTLNHQLIGCYQDKIQEEMELWQSLFKSLNEFFLDWNSFFSEKLSIEEFYQFLETPDRSLFIQEKHINADPEYRHFMGKLKVKLRKLIDLVEFPEFSHLLKNAEVIENKLLQINADDREKWIIQCFEGTSFSIQDQLKQFIIQKFTVYARTPSEIMAYHFLSRFCDLVNILADSGADYDITDFPPSILLNNVIWKKGNLLPGSDKFSRHCEVSPSFIRKESAIIRRFENLSMDRIIQLIDALSN